MSTLHTLKLSISWHLQDHINMLPLLDLKSLSRIESSKSIKTVKDSPSIRSIAIIYSCPLRKQNLLNELQFKLWLNTEVTRTDPATSKPKSFLISTTPSLSQSCRKLHSIDQNSTVKMESSEPRLLQLSPQSLRRCSLLLVLFIAQLSILLWVQLLAAMIPSDPLLTSSQLGFTMKSKSALLFSLMSDPSTEYSISCAT